MSVCYIKCFLFLPVRSRPLYGNDDIVRQSEKGGVGAKCVCGGGGGSRVFSRVDGSKCGKERDGKF